ncbi:MAG: pyruvoyl-dependent arginine decarboxylase [Halodesulfurarchaeum sp.]
MTTVRVVWGTGHGPTDIAAYDAALADAGAHNFNLVRVSSIVPADATLEVVGTAPDLGPAGSRLTIVEGHAEAAGPAQVAAGLGWSVGPGPGLLYEAGGEAPPEAIAERIRTGLAAGRDLRDWRFEETDVRTVDAEVDEGEYVAATVLAILGEGDPID